MEPLLADSRSNLTPLPITVQRFPAKSTLIVEDYLSNYTWPRFAQYTVVSKSLAETATRFICAVQSNLKQWHDRLKLFYFTQTESWQRKTQTVSDACDMTTRTVRDRVHSIWKRIQKVGVGNISIKRPPLTSGLLYGAHSVIVEYCTGLARCVSCQL